MNVFDRAVYITSQVIDARTSMTWLQHPQKQSNKTKIIDLSHTVTGIHALTVYRSHVKDCKTLKAHNSSTAADTLVKLPHFRSAPSRSFIWAQLRRSISYRYKVPSLSPWGTKNFRVMQRKYEGRCISSLVELRWKMTVLVIFRLLGQTWPWHDPWSWLWPSK